MGFLKALNVNLVVAQIISFLVVLWLMKKYLWKPVFAVLEERRARIDAELKAIEATKSDVAKLKGEYEAFLGRVDELAQKRIKEAAALGEVKAGEIREKARQEAERIVEDARREILFEFAKSRETLKVEIIEMVIKMTEQMIQEKLTFDSDRKIIDKMLTDLEKTS